MIPDVAGSSPVGRPKLQIIKVSFLESFFLGIIQGLSEFLPISSSFHIKMATKIFKITPYSPLFELSCHLGTALSAIIFLRKEIKKIFLQKRIKILHIFIAILPLIPFYIFFRNFIQNIELLGLFLIISSLFLFTTSLLKERKEKNSSLNGKIKDVLFIGLMQACALFPGISRSGSTISAACFRGWHVKEAISFSFILAIPTILGGSVLETLKFLKDKPTFDHSVITGFFASFLIGLITIHFIFKIKSRKKFLPFAFYCLIVGILTLIYF